MVLGLALVANLEYDPVNDFDHLGVITVSFTTLISRAGLPAASFPEFVAHLKSNGDKIMFANSDLGGISHLCGLMLSEALQASSKDPDFSGYLDKAGYTAVPPAETLPAAQARRAKAEVERWGKLLREAEVWPQ